MSDKIAFATATFGGFEKKQVLDYIYKMHEEIDNDKLKHRKKLEEISVAFRELEQRTRLAEGDKLKALEELGKARQSLEVEQRKTLKLETEKNELAQKLSQYERILLQRKQPDYSDIVANQMTETALPSETSKPAVNIDEASEQIGKIMLEAHTKAEAIVANAQSEAAKIIKETQKSIKEKNEINEANIKAQRDNLEKETERIIQAANEKIRSQAVLAYTKAKTLVEEIYLATNSAENYIATLSSQVNELGSSTDSLILRLSSDNVGDILSDLTEIIPQKDQPILDKYHYLFSDDSTSESTVAKANSNKIPAKPVDPPASIADFQDSSETDFELASSFEDKIEPITFPSLNPPDYYKKDENS